MSFDVAVWEGPRPADEADAQAEFARRCEVSYARADAGLSPARATPRLRAFIADVRRYFPDGDRDLDGVWADGRLFEGVDGDFLHTVLTGEGLERALDVLAGLAGKHGLVFFDPLTGDVLERPVPSPPVRRPPRPGVGTLQRFLLGELTPVGFAPVKGGLRLDLPDDVRVMLTPFVSTERGVRVADASIAVYREGDWQEYLRWEAKEFGARYDPEAKFLGGYGNVLDFGLMFPAGELLDRPHHHGWLVPDRAAVQVAGQAIAGLVVDRVLPSVQGLAALLPNRRLGMRHEAVLGIRGLKRLGQEEVCPWAPCGEMYRKVEAGGLWPAVDLGPDNGSDVDFFDEGRVDG